MKRLATCIFVSALCLSFWLPAVAQSHNARVTQSRSSRELEKKQRKAQKKYAKAQRKAQRKMARQSRKNTHYPNRHY